MALTWEIARRGMMRLMRRPSLLIPSLVMPTFFILAFGNSFRSLTDVEGFGTDNVFNWMAPYAILQGAAMGGMGAPGMVAQDLDNGFMDRMLLTPGRRVPLIAGPILYSALRALMPTVLVLLLAYLNGARLTGPLGLVTLVAAAAGTGVMFALLGMVFVLKLRSMRALGLVQISVFISTFLSIGQVPLSFLSGWMHTVARLNPITNILRLARQGFLGDVTWHDTWPGLLALGLLIGALALLTRRNLRLLAP